MKDPAHARALNRPLRSARLALEPLTADHADELFEPLQAPAIYQWISSERPASVEALRARWAQHETRRSPDGASAWLNWIARDPAGACIGRSDVEIDGDVANNVGYVLVPSAWGRGYATEAVRVMLRFLRDGLAVTRFTASIDARNAASLRLVERLGFTPAGRLRGANESGGVVSDELLFERPAAGPGLDLG